MERRGEICPEEVRVRVGNQTWELACHLALYNRHIALVTKVICLGGGAGGREGTHKWRILKGVVLNMLN